MSSDSVEIVDLFAPLGPALCISIIYEFAAAGTKQGLDLKSIQEIIAVEFAIESGSIPIPWSQEECENGVDETGALLENTQALIAMHPEFVQVAATWAWEQYGFMFYLLWKQYGY